MAYVNALKQISRFVATNWKLTPIKFVNAPSPKMLSNGDYAGCYVRIYTTSTDTDIELSIDKTRLERGYAHFDIHIPPDSNYLLSDELVSIAATMLNGSYGHVDFNVAEITPDAGYFVDGTHVSRLEIEYRCDYTLSQCDVHDFEKIAIVEETIEAAELLP